MKPLLRHGAIVLATTLAISVAVPPSNAADVAEPRRMFDASFVDSYDYISLSEHSHSERKPQRTASVGLAIDAIGMSNRINPVQITQPISLDESNSLDRASRRSFVIQPTAGRFIQRETGWSFVPNDGSAKLAISTHPEVDSAGGVSNLLRSRNSFSDVAAVDKLRQSVQNFVELFPANPLRSATSPQNSSELADNDRHLHSASAKSPVAATQQIELSEVVVKNDLVLQRVLQTIRKAKFSQQVHRDVAGSVPSSVPSSAAAIVSVNDELAWNVTGEIFQLDGRPRLALHTATPIRR